MGEFGYHRLMGLLSSFRAAVVALPLGLAACSGTTAASNGPSQANPLDGEESAAIVALNTLRAAQSPPSPSVIACFALNFSASAHSDDMRDHGYLAESPPNDPQSTVRTRACSAGYTPACSANLAMGELVASGYGTGQDTINGWDGDMTSKPILLNPVFVVAGIGRSLGANIETWTLDLAAKPDPSCH
jgi:uncharacterized protein YkwD